MSTQVIAIENAKTGEGTEAVYEHPFVVRLCHWLNAVALFVMIGSGLQIFRAFPSFGAKIPQKDLINWPESFAIGGWLGGRRGRSPGRGGGCRWRARPGRAGWAIGRGRGGW